MKRVNIHGSLWPWYCCCLLLFSSACSKSPDISENIQEFTAGVEELLGQSVDANMVDYTSLVYPRRRDSFIERPDSRIGMMEFLRLADCRLNVLVATHNNTLNRFQDHVERLFYDLAFVELAAECIAKAGQPENTLYQKLAVARIEKQQALPASLWNAVFSSRELSEFFSVYTSLPQQQDISIPTDVANALTFITVFADKIRNDAAGRDVELEKLRADFDNALGLLGREKYAGALLRAAAFSNAHLAALNEKLLHANSLCVDSQTALFAEQSKSVSGLAVAFRDDIDPVIRDILVAMKKVGKLRKIFDYAELRNQDLVRNYWQPYWGQEPQGLYHTLSVALEEQRAHWARLLAQCQVAL